MNKARLAGSYDLQRDVSFQCSRHGFCRECLGLRVLQDPTGIITGVSCWVEHLFGLSMFMSYFGLHMFVSIHQPCLHSLHTVLFSRQEMQMHGVNKRKPPTNKIMLSHKNSLRPYLLHDVACLVIIHSSPIVAYQVSSSGFPATRWMDELSPGTVRQHCDERCKFVPPLGCRLVQRCMEQILVICALAQRSLRFARRVWRPISCSIKVPRLLVLFPLKSPNLGATNALMARYAIGVRSCSFFVAAGPRWTKVFRFYQSARAACLKSTGWIRTSFVRRSRCRGIQCDLTYFNFSCFFSSWLHL